MAAALLHRARTEPISDSLLDEIHLFARDRLCVQATPENPSPKQNPAVEAWAGPLLALCVYRYNFRMDAPELREGLIKTLSQAS